MKIAKLLCFLAVFVSAFAQQEKDDVQINQEYVDFLISDTATVLSLNSMDLWDKVKSTALENKLDPFSVLLQLRQELQLDTDLDELTDRESGEESDEDSDQHIDLGRSSLTFEDDLTTGSFPPPTLPFKMFNNKLVSGDVSISENFRSKLQIAADGINKVVKLSGLNELVDKYVPPTVKLLVGQSFRMVYNFLSITERVVRAKIYPFIRSQLKHGSRVRKVSSQLLEKTKQTFNFLQQKVNEAR